MLSALLALLLLAATIDPRLVEPLRLLAEIGARETVDSEPGQVYADLPESLGLTLVVATLPRNGAGRYDPNTRTVTVAERLRGESPEALALVLVHEMQHAVDHKRRILGLLDVDCIGFEVRGFVAASQVARAFWPDQLPDETPFEREIAAMVSDYEANGTAGLAARVAGTGGYRQSCTNWRE